MLEKVRRFNKVVKLLTDMGWMEKPKRFGLFQSEIIERIWETNKYLKSYLNAEEVVVWLEDAYD